MAGDVWEWCDSVYRESSGHRVLHGGSFYFHADFVRSAFRIVRRPDERDRSLGIRVARAYY